MPTPINDEAIMPNSFELTFLHLSEPFCTVPVYLLTTLAKPNIKCSEDESLSELLSSTPDQIDLFLTSKLFDLFARTIKWKTIEPYISCSSYLKKSFGIAWTGNLFEKGQFSFLVRAADLPPRIYRYMPFNADRARVLLNDGKLFMPCPSMFNDPFDCSFDDKHRLTFIESAIGCFSTLRDNILMFSHYAKYHQGICVGFDTRRLVCSLADNNKPMAAQIRRVSYLAKMPPLDLLTQPALCATSKHDIWSYEQEFRIFMSNDNKLAPFGEFAFDRKAIREVIYGCKASEETIAHCKKFTHGLTDIRHRKAVQVANQFGVQMEDLPRI